MFTGSLVAIVTPFRNGKLMSEPSVTLLNGRSIMVPTELSLVGPLVNRPRSPMPNTIVGGLHG